MKGEQIEVNPDGITAYCDFCKTSKPKEGFTVAILFLGDYYNQSEYGQQCKDCRDAVTKHELEMEEYYSELQDDYESGRL